jgi:hypothetical protein
MELLESNDMKSELIKKSARHKQNLQDEVKLISERTEKALTTALIVGGTLAASYLLVRALAGGSDSKKKGIKGKHKKIKIVHAAAAAPVETVETDAAQSSSIVPNILSHVGTVIASQAMATLLSVAKEKLSEYLSERNAEKEKQV